MKQTFWILTLFLITSCATQKLKIEKITFTTDYKLNSEIETELAKSSVAWKHQISASEYAKTFAKIF